MNYHCYYCMNPCASCTCPAGANDVAGYSSTGLPVDADGQILHHLLSREQRREIERRCLEATPVPQLMRRQAS